MQLDEGPHQGKAKPDLVPGVFAYIKALADGVRGVRKA